jgi:Glycosyltransferase family 87
MTQVSTRGGIKGPLGLLLLPAKGLAWLLGIRPSMLSAGEGIALSAALLAVVFALARSWEDAHQYPGVDLRSRIVGARNLLDGHSPYFTDQPPQSPERLIDPGRMFSGVSQCTYSPATLAIYAPIANRPYGWQRPVWACVELGSFLVSVGLLTRSIPGHRAKVLFASGALVLFGADWSMRLHVERGQYYVYILLLISMGVFCAMKLRRGTLKRTDSFLAGLLLGAASAVRPSVIVVAGPVLLLRRWRMSLGVFAGAAAMVAATTLMTPLSTWSDYLKMGEKYEQMSLQGQAALDYEYLVRPDTVRGNKHYLEGVPFANLSGKDAGLLMLPTESRPLVLTSVWLAFPAVQRAVPASAVPAINKGAALALCGLSGLACLKARRRRYSLPLVLAAGLALFNCTEYLLPVRCSYADVLYLPLLAMLSPLLARRKGAPARLLLVAGLGPNLLFPDPWLAAVRTFTLLVVTVFLAYRVLVVRPKTRRDARLRRVG